MVVYIYNLPTFYDSCKSFLEFIKHENGLYELKNCNAQEGCSGCFMNRPNHPMSKSEIENYSIQHIIHTGYSTGLIPFVPDQVINYKEIGCNFESPRMRIGNVVYLDPEYVKTELEPYVNSKEIWFYGRSFCLDLDTIILYQIRDLQIPLNSFYNFKPEDHFLPNLKM